MKLLKSHFRFTQSQRSGILFLTLSIVILLFSNFFIDFSSKDSYLIDSKEAQKFQQEIDSLKQIELENRNLKIYPFNPSFLTDYKAYQLGMTTEEIDRLLQHRKNGKYINSAKEFQQVTQVSDSLLDIISPYFKFPNWVTNQKNNSSKRSAIDSPTNQSMTTAVKDINSATVTELKSVNGIGDKLARRIIKYRDLLGGFSLNDQVYEVYYLDKDIANRVLEHFQVIEKPFIEKINVNTASFKEVLSIVYIDYELTGKICNYRDEVAEVQSLEELKKIEGFPVEKFDRIALYLEAK